MRATLGRLARQVRPCIGGNRRQPTENRTAAGEPRDTSREDRGADVRGPLLSSARCELVATLVVGQVGLSAIAYHERRGVAGRRWDSTLAALWRGVALGLTGVLAGLLDVVVLLSSHDRALHN